MRVLRLAVFACLAAATPCPGAITPDGDATQVHSAQPGETYRGTLSIRNTGAQIAQVKLYQTDYAFSADGSNDFASPGTLARSNAGWLRLHQEQVTVAPQGVVNVDYEVHVPVGKLTGTYWSVVMVQELPPLESTGPARNGVRLSQVLRHAIQVVTEIGESGRSDLVFHNAQLLGEGARREFSVDLENVGERWLRTDTWLELHDAQGHFAGRFSGRRGRTFPGTSVRSRIELSGAPPGKYLGLLVADGGRNDLFGMQVELDLR